MNHLLKAKGKLCRTRCRVLGFEIEVIDCQKHLILLVNKKNEKVAAVGLTVGTKEGDVEIESFMIDVRKWMWAESEGFSMEEMVDPKGDLRDTIFLRASFEDLPNLLK